MEFLDVVRNRRSARSFLPREVPEDALMEMLDAGRLAPTSGGKQNFYFGVVRDEETKRELARAAGQDWIATAPAVIAHCASLGPDLATAPADSSGLEVNRLRFGDDLITYLNAYPDRHAMRVFFENGVPFLPGQQVFLAAVNRGLSACWVGHLDTRRASEILRLPEGMVCLFLMPVGYPAQAPKERSFRTVEECAFYDTWPGSS